MYCTSFSAAGLTEAGGLFLIFPLVGDVLSCILMSSPLPFLSDLLEPLTVVGLVEADEVVPVFVSPFRFAFVVDFVISFSLESTRKSSSEGE